MGYRQIERAIEMLQNAAKIGEWVCFYNIHLVCEWLPKLWKLICDITKARAHSDFRLWMTSEPRDEVFTFGSKIIEMSEKVVFENPPGIRESLKLSYSLLENRSNTKSLQCQSKYSRLVFILSWFHAVVQERSFYNPQGWSTQYHFNNEDFELCLELIDKHYDRNDIDWLYLHDMILRFVYGAKIDNLFDLKVLEIYCKTYFNADVLQGKLDLATGVRVPLSKNPVMHIRELPEGIDSPCVFGLPENSNFGLQRALCDRALDTLKRLSYSSKTMAFKNADRNCFIIDQWANLINGKEKELQFESSVLTDDVDQIRVFLVSELKLGTKLFSVVDLDISLIKQMIATNEKVSDETRRIATNVNNGFVPESWKKIWHGPDNLVSWLYEIVDKILKLKELLKNM